MPWEVLATPIYDEWFASLDADGQDDVVARIERLAEIGPSLGRPTVDTLKSSRHSNLKELRCGTMRVIFAFNNRRKAVLLVGGDKRDDWDAFYRREIPRADDLFDEFKDA